MAVLEQSPTTFGHGLGDSISSISLLTLSHGHNFDAWNFHLLGEIIDNLSGVTTFLDQIQNWLSFFGKWENLINGVGHWIDEFLTKGGLDEDL
jgi:hypothetical protein